MLRSTCLRGFWVARDVCDRARVVLPARASVTPSRATGVGLRTWVANVAGHVSRPARRRLTWRGSPRPTDPKPRPGFGARPFHTRTPARGSSARVPNMRGQTWSWGPEEVPGATVAEKQ